MKRKIKPPMKHRETSRGWQNVPSDFIILGEEMDKVTLWHYPQYCIGIVTKTRILHGITCSHPTSYG